MDVLLYILQETSTTTGLESLVDGNWVEPKKSHTLLDKELRPHIASLLYSSEQHLSGLYHNLQPKPVSRRYPHYNILARAKQPRFQPKQIKKKHKNHIHQPTLPHLNQCTGNLTATNTFIVSILYSYLQSHMFRSRRE